MSCNERYASRDANGVQHILLCDVAQGNPEQVQRGSKQFASSAPHFNTAVDKLVKPTRYIV